MYLYSITINIDDDVLEEWLKWMREYFVPELFKSALFSDKKFYELINDEKSGGTTYSLQLFMKSLQEYEKYQEQLCYDHQVMMHAKFNSKFVEFRTLLKLVE